MRKCHITIIDTNTFSKKHLVRDEEDLLDCLKSEIGDIYPLTFKSTLLNGNGYLSSGTNTSGSKAFSNICLDIPEESIEWNIEDNIGDAAEIISLILTEKYQSDFIEELEQYKNIFY